MEQRNILVVDDERMIREAVSSYLEKKGFQVFCAENGLEALAVFEKEEIGFIILDLMLPFIFERFYRTDSSRSRRTGGSGIGLTIVKAIVQAHGGKIEVTSEEGKGSCFTIILRRTPE